MANVLIIHDHASLRASIVDSIRRNNDRAWEATDLGHACADHPRDGAPLDVVVATTGVGGSAAVVAAAKAAWPQAEIILIGHSRELKEATEAVRQGAFDYIASPPDPLHLIRAIRAATAARRTASERESRDRRDDFDETAALDPLTRAAFSKADRAAGVKCTVLITGESGTGKEGLARRIHQRSPRRGRFSPVNCGSLPETLIETELFGYRRGAFTGAVANTKGLIEEAEGGTLFLDEIGDMPLAVQVRLLRFLDSGEIRPVGGTCVQHVDVRVIAATNRCLRTEIVEGRFRADLFFRLSVISLELPPLRDRRADLDFLIEAQVRRVASRLAMPVPAVSKEALSLLLRYTWPGNFRELQNAIEHALVQSPGRLITPEDLPAMVQRGGHPFVPSVAQTVADTREQLLAVLYRNGGNHSKAALELGISRTTLWRRLRELGGEATTSINTRAMSVS